MFNRKRIKAMEQEIAQLKDQLLRLANSTKDLVTFSAAISLNAECAESYLEGKSEEETVAFLSYKDRYERGLRRYIRSVTSKKKMVSKVINDGKEKPADTK